MLTILNHATTSAVGPDETKTLGSTPNNIITFTAIGNGTGTWSATANIVPLVDYNKYDTPLTLSISNSATVQSITIETAYRTFGAYLSSISGSADVTVKVLGN